MNNSNINCLNSSLIINIESYNSKYHIKCSEWERLNLKVPANLLINNITQIHLPKHPCELTWHMCDSLFIHSLMYLGWLLLLASLLILIRLRYKMLKNDIVKGGYKTQFYKYGLSITNTNIIYRYSYIKVLCYLLFGLKLVSGCMIFHDNVAQGYGANTICTTSGNLTIPKLDNTVLLTGMYETSTWDLTHNTDWGCAGGSCPSIGECEAMMNSLRKIHDGYWIKDYCYSFQKGCFAGRGCRYGNYELVIKRKFQVFQTSLIVSKSETDLYIGDCSISLYRDVGQVLGIHYFVISKSVTWICPESSNLGNPKLSTLGDLQILNNETSILFPWDQLKCSSSWYEDECILPKSFLLLVDENCQRLPSMTNWGYMKYINNKLYIENDDVVNVKSHCNKTKMLSSVNCDAAIINLWGTKQHETGLYLTILVNSKQIGLDTEVKNPCSGEMISVPCDGKLHFYPVSEDQYPCNNSVIDNTLNNQQSYYLQFHDKEHFTFIDSLLHVNNPILHLLGSGIGSIFIWILILILLCRK